MTKDEEALALKLIEDFFDEHTDLDHVVAYAAAVLDAIRAQQEPVAWRVESEIPMETGYDVVFDYAEFPMVGATALFTTPPVAAIPDGWISVTEHLPESGKPVLAQVGRLVIRAAYAAKFTLDEENWGWWNDGDGADYNEANDTTYWPEGWYEWNQHEEIHWSVTDVTHWMPLPEAPNAKVSGRPHHETEKE